jgi:hypothetical protein
MLDRPGRNAATDQLFVRLLEFVAKMVDTTGDSLSKPARFTSACDDSRIVASSHPGNMSATSEGGELSPCGGICASL